MLQEVGMNPIKKSKRNLKRKVAKTAGVPTTKSGRKRKLDRAQGQAIFWLIIVGVVSFLLSSESDAAIIDNLRYM